MQFSMDEWFKFHEEAIEAGKSLHQLRLEQGGKLKMNHENTLYRISCITHILERCSKYMDRCGLGMPNTLWSYDHKDETTHISSKVFAYKHLLHLL